MRNLLLTFSIAMLFACTDGNNNSDSGNSKPTFRTFTYKNQSGECLGEQSNCFTIRYSYPEMETGNSTLKALFDAEMADIVQERLMDLLESPEPGSSTEDLVQQLFKAFQLLQSDEEAYLMKWEVSIDCEILYQVDNMLSISVNHFTYMGGAHPDTYVNFRNYSLPDLNRITIEDIVQDTASLLSIAEQIFRSTYQIPDGSSFSEQGYWFEEDAFYLPENFALTSTGIIFRFNPYEIGPYAIGSHEIKIPYELIKDLLPKQLYL